MRLENIKEALAECLEQPTGFSSAEILPLLEKPKNEAHGDLALPCFAFAKKLKKNPKELAEEIAVSAKLPKEISKAHAIGPFLNFSLNLSTLKQVEDLALLPTHFTDVNSKKKILIEYSSPNIAKPFHVGHLRATLIGNCLDRVYRYLGFQVESINHLGDWGTQFGFVYAGCQIWGEPKDFSVESLVALYKKATALKEEEEKQEKPSTDANGIARTFFIDLEKGEEYALSFWKKCVEVSLEYFKNTYSRLGVSFDHYIGESFYSDKLDNVKNLLEENKILQESEGAFGIDLGDKLGFARVLTPDGRSLYLTRDIAAAEYRHETFSFESCLYVVGAPQTLHFQQLKAIIKKLSRPYADGITHIPFGHVLGMKTRGAGTVIELNSFLDDAITKAKDACKKELEKDTINVDDVSSKVALSAIIFSTLNRNNIKDVHFSWEDALSFQGDTGPYLLYAYARLHNIESQAIKKGIKKAETFDIHAVDTESGVMLIKTLLEFEQVLLQIIKDQEPIHLCNFSLDLARAISKAYLDLRVVDAEPSQAASRLALFSKAKEVLSTTLNLLGIDTVDRM